MYSRQIFIFLIAVLYALTGARASAQPASIVGPGCTTATMIDWDCDGYGPGSPLGPDADDNDPAVNTAASFDAKYGNLAAGLAHLGYHPSRIWQISPAGKDGNCKPGGAPCATFLKGVAQRLRAGDAVVYRAGTYPLTAYTVNIAVSGTASKPIIVMAYPGERAVLDWSVSNQDGIGLNGQSYVTLDGLVLKGGANGMGITEIGYNPVSNVTLRNMQIIGFYNSVWMTPFNNFLYERSVFGPSNPGGEHNLYLMGNPVPSSNLIIRNNLIFSNGGGGGHNIHLNGRFPNALVQGNIMYNAQNNCLGLQTGVNHSTFENNVCFTTANSAISLSDYYQDSNGDIRAYDQNYNVFRNNTIYFTGTNYTDGSVGCTQYPYWVFDTSAGTCKKHGGTCSFVKGAGVCSGAKGSCSLANLNGVSHDLGHNTFDNNIFVSACANESAALRYDLDANGEGGAAWLATDTWRNNIFYNRNGAPYEINFLAVYAFPENSEVLSTSRSFAQFQAAVPGGATNRQADPKFVAASQAWYNAPQKFNFQVQPGSPAIGVGLESDAPSTDLMRKPRGNRPDIGAYQFAGGPVAASLSLDCDPTGQPSGVSATCTIRLSQAAPAGGAIVALASNSTMVTVPASVAVAAGKNSATFAVAGGDDAPSGRATITARLNGVSETFAVMLLPTRDGEY